MEQESLVSRVTWFFMSLRYRLHESVTSVQESASTRLLLEE
jgi:hypothetical protein